MPREVSATQKVEGWELCLSDSPVWRILIITINTSMGIIQLGACEHAHTHADVSGRSSQWWMVRCKRVRKRNGEERVGKILEAQPVLGLFFNLMVEWGGLVMDYS